MNNMTFSKKEALKFGWENFKKKGWFLVGVTLVFYLIAIGATLIAQGYPILGNIIGILIQWWVAFGMISILLGIYNGKEVSFKDLFSTDWKRVWNYMLGTIIFSVIILVGFILLIVPGIIWSLKYQYFSYLIIEKNMKPIDAIKRSGKMTYGHKWNIFLFMLLTTLISLLGLIVLGVGLLVAIPVVMLANVWVYKWLLEHEGIVVKEGGDNMEMKEEKVEVKEESKMIEENGEAESKDKGEN